MLPLIDLIHATSESLTYPASAANLSITGLATDSRNVKPGYMFIALKGEHVDGAAFIEKAKAAGAVAVLCDTNTAPDVAGIVLIKAENPMVVMAHMAAKLYAGQPTHMVAVTGTDGKTSTADFYRQFWYHMGKSSASIGTLGVLSGAGKNLYPGSHTTPYPVPLHSMLSALNVDYACMEASSHGLHQYRLDGVNIEAAAFTNLTRDHLDYHKTEEAYFAAKMRLFGELLPEGKTAVINQDDGHFDAVKAICKKRNHRIIGFGKNGEQFRVVKHTPLPHGQQVDAELFGKFYQLDIPLVGAFQSMNILAALGLVSATGGNIEQALAVIPQFAGVPGRLEQVVQLSNGATIFVDYAHTPMALANILQTLRPHTQQRLHVVFGCGGDRDTGKRPEMAIAAERFADRVIVTDDNPRSENPAAIRTAIMTATTRAKEVADRREAIYVALRDLSAGDILVIAGKGHEKIQIIGDNTYPFDDAQVARLAASELKLVA
jgi:UDP-N-acetylmuramoyl-L-alanyl-D-glutamate--2,6-diaminopimelate ligase